MAAGSEQITTCSKIQDDGKICGRELDTAGSPQWCKACRAKYQREYQATRNEMGEAKGYVKGVDAMRDAAARHFADFGPGMFSGLEVAEVVRSLPYPARREA